MGDPIVVHAGGARIPALGLGTFRSEGGECAEIVAHALNVGYRHLDTAKMYGNEHQVGEGLKASGVPRDSVFVTTKVWWDDIADGDLQRSAEGSLKRLGIDVVDLLLIHWPNPAIPLASSIKGLCDARKRGLARHVGVSNFPVAMVREAVRLADVPLVANQCEYHPTLDQSKLRAACRSNDMAFVSYCPLGRGRDVSDPVIAEIADRHGKSPAQVILRWLVQQPGVVAIPKSASKARVEENAAIWDFELDEDDMLEIARLRRPDGRVVNPVFAPQWD
ncbi:aldo/keto reductase [uncultured Alsobacter sp.]|uniref:aldo/keto reductase n=1 Tax=uncultured Alsobacter sp. TaxID=1748258 RepID=UPI0025E0A67D|nr:aldo/keto reductase [uncultured Alsobacter sp.]